MKDHFKHIFTIPDLVDLEYFFHQDSENDAPDPGQLHQRDRNIFLSDIAPIVTDMGEDRLKRKIAIRRWLDIRRRPDASESGKERTIGLNPTPGKALETALNLMGVVLVCCGMGGGAGLAASLLFYSGNRPVNITLFIGLVVVVQIMLIVFLLLIWGIGRTGRHMYPGAYVIQAGVAGVMQWMVRRTRPSIPGASMGRMTATSGMLKRMKQIYGSVLLWPFFRLAQLFGIMFNIGVLLSAWIRILGTDLAFGWQSTLQIGAGTAYKIVSMMALPWTWMMPSGMAHPSLSQIQGSRIILKDGITQLSTTDMASWWPFLLFSVVCYGLIPRLVLFFMARAGERKALSRIGFDTYACARLWMRMTTPVIGEIEPEEVLATPMPEAIHHEVVGDGAIDVADHGLVAMLSEDLFDGVTSDSLARLTRRLTGIPTTTATAVTLDFSKDRETLMEKRSDHLTHIVFLQEGWQPPIREILYYLKELRLFVGREVNIIVFLVGKPEVDNVLTPVSDADYRIWQHGIQGLGDSRTLVERIVT